jgi:phosphoglycolate phosphatase
LKSQGVKETLRSAKIPFWKLPLLLKRVREEQAKRIGQTVVFEGIKDVLQKLRKAGLTLGILTSNSEENVEKMLGINDLAIFDFIISKSSLFGKARILRTIIKEKKLDPEGVYYIGDEVRDIEAARGAKIKSIAVTWGYDDASLLSQFKPDFIISKPESFLQIFETKKEVKANSTSRKK